MVHGSWGWSLGTNKIKLYTEVEPHRKALGTKPMVL